MLGVFDGHSGSEAAEFAREKLLGHIKVDTTHFIVCVCVYIYMVYILYIYIGSCRDLEQREWRGGELESRNYCKALPQDRYASPRSNQSFLPLGMLRTNALFHLLSLLKLA